jgi:hypothetical protein
MVGSRVVGSAFEIARVQQAERIERVLQLLPQLARGGIEPRLLGIGVNRRRTLIKRRRRFTPLADCCVPAAALGVRELTFQQVPKLRGPSLLNRLSTGIEC